MTDVRTRSPALDSAAERLERVRAYCRREIASAKDRQRLAAMDGAIAGGSETLLVLETVLRIADSGVA